jgi:polyvinyl alcohol dehydrogenase (cytochrome)
LLLTGGLLAAVVLAPGMTGPVAASPRTAAVIGPTDWPQFLHDAGHSSVGAGATTITPANAGNLSAAWSWTPPSVAGRPAPTMYASPTVAGGLIYVGTRSGWLYALDQATGQQVWAADTGYLVTTCSGSPARGLTATPTVAADPVTGNLVVFEAGADTTGSAGNITLYAFDAATGQQLWATPVSTATGAYAWASPMVAGGQVYVGVSSACDAPLVTGQVVGIDQHTGTVDGTYQADATGVLGAGIWTTPASDGTDVWATTGNGTTESGVPDTPVGDEESLVQINGTTLAREDGWQVPPSRADQDFASSPTLFSAVHDGSPTDFVGACDKNGIFYALERGNLSAGPVWQTSVATSSDAACDPAAVWDSGLGRLDLGTATVTVGGTTYPGSIVQLDPGTGAIVWRTAMPARVLGTPTVNGAGVLAAGTYTSYQDVNAAADVVLMNAATGQVLGQISTVGPVFAQPVFAGGNLLIASTVSLIAYAPAAVTPAVTMEQTANAVTFGGWARAAVHGALAGAVRRSTTVQDSTSYSFTGRAASWIGFTGPASGRVSVGIDGKPPRIVDLYGATQTRKAVEFSGLGAGPHTIRAVVLHTKNAKSRGFAVSSDGFVVGKSRIDDAANQVGYDAWVGLSDPGASGGSYRTSATANSTVSVGFTGSSITWVTATGPSAGQADVVIDGVDQGNVDLYSPNTTWQVPETYAVAAGHHTLQITVLGSHDLAATGSNVVVDGFGVS